MAQCANRKFHPHIEERGPEARAPRRSRKCHCSCSATVTSPAGGPRTQAFAEDPKLKTPSPTRISVPLGTQAPVCTLRSTHEHAGEGGRAPIPAHTAPLTLQNHRIIAFTSHFSFRMCTYERNLDL